MSFEEELLKKAKEKLNEVRRLRSDVNKRIKAGLEQVRTEQEIQDQIDRIAQEIIAEYRGKNPVLLSLLEGAKHFSSQLELAIARIDSEFRFDSSCIQTSSYSGTESGAVKVYNLSDKVTYTDRDIIILDEVCDTGKTLKKVIEVLKQQFPSQIETAVLCDKYQKRLFMNAELEKVQFNPNYVGFNLGKDAFIVGYGLDYDEAFRELPGIYNVNPNTLPTSEETKELKQEKQLASDLKSLYQQIAEQEQAELSHALSESTTKVSLGDVWCGSFSNSKLPPSPTAPSSTQLVGFN